MAQKAQYDDLGDGAGSGYDALRHILASEDEPEFGSADSVPLFLRDDEEPDALTLRRSLGEIFSSTIFKAGVVVVVTAGLAVAVLSRAKPFVASPDDQASLTSAPADPSPVDSTIAPARSPPATTNTPTREEIAATFESARQSQIDNSVRPGQTDNDMRQSLIDSGARQRQADSGVRQPAQTDSRPRATTAPAASARQLDADELAAMIKRARSLISIGDIAAARLLLKRAAEAQDPAAALLLAQTYDPKVLGSTDARSLTADSAMAQKWYDKAAQLGLVDTPRTVAQTKN